MKRKDMLAVPEVITSQRIDSTRKYCRRNGIPFPAWAEYRDKLNPLIMRTGSYHEIARCRSYCRRNGISVPAWAKKLPKKPEPGKYLDQFGRNIFTASAVWVETNLATSYNDNRFWKNAEGMVEALGDKALTDAVMSHSPNAMQEAKRVCMELNPLFGRLKEVNHRSIKNKHKRGDLRKAGTSKDQRKAWAEFCDEAGIKDTTEAVKFANGGGGK